MKNEENLDVGCGHVFGHHKRGSIRINLKRGKADIIGNVNCLPIKDNAFDKVLCYYLPEHVVDGPPIIRIGAHAGISIKMTTHDFDRYLEWITCL